MPDSPQLSKIERLRLWFKSPVSKLSGDDAFVVLMVSMSLFERFVKASLKEQNLKATPEKFRQEAAHILNLDSNLFNKFWGMYRDGMQHYLQPKTFTSGDIKYSWEISSRHSKLPEFRIDSPTHHTVIVNPWEWFSLVFDLWEGRPDLLDKLSEYPIGSIY